MRNKKIITGIGMMAVMMAVATGCSNTSNTVSTEETTTVAESTMSEEERALSDYKTYGMQKDPIPGIIELVKAYQYAKVNADARRMYNVFGRSDEDGLADLQAKLTDEAKVYESFDDTVTYVTKGYEDNSYVVFISSNVKFHDIDTKAPMLTWAYVMENPKDAFYMVENEKKYVDEVSKSEDIIALDAQMRKDLAAAVTSDIQLGTLYSIWVKNASTNETAAAAETSTAAETSSAESSEEESTVESISETTKNEANISIAETKSGN